MIVYEALYKTRREGFVNKGLNRISLHADLVGCELLVSSCQNSRNLVSR